MYIKNSFKTVVQNIPPSVSLLSGVFSYVATPEFIRNGWRGVQGAFLTGIGTGAVSAMIIVPASLALGGLAFVGSRLIKYNGERISTDDSIEYWDIGVFGGAAIGAFMGMYLAYGPMHDVVLNGMPKQPAVTQTLMLTPNN